MGDTVLRQGLLIQVPALPGGIAGSARNSHDHDLPTVAHRSIPMKCLALLVLSTAIAQGQTAPTPTLKDAYKGLFHIGAALNTAQFEDRDPIADPVIESQFDTISPENDLKWQLIHPTLDHYNFDPADRYVAFGEKHKMFIVGHCLVWHSQVPRWVLQDATGKPLRSEEHTSELQSLRHLVCRLLLEK